MASRLRTAQSRRLVEELLAVGGVALVAALFIWPPPRSIATVGTLDECSFGWPVIELDDAAWHAAFPRDEGSYVARQLPVLAWPSGMKFDEPTNVLLDPQGHAVFRTGAQVRVSGTIVDMSRGDIPPCFLSLGVRVDSIVSP